MRRRRGFVLVGALLAMTTAGVALASVTTSGRVGPATGMTANGRLLAPAGRMTALGDFPSGGALSPDGRFYWAVDSGHGQDDVRVVDVASGAVRQVLPLPGAYGGIAWAPDGRTAFVSGEATGNSHPAGPTKGGQGDVVHVFIVDPATGTASEGFPIALPATNGGTAQQENANPASIILRNPAPGPGPSSGPGWPIGMAVTADGRYLTVALNQADRVAIVDLTTGTTSLVKVGTYPYGVAVNGYSAFVSNEADGTLSEVDLDKGAVTRTITVGPATSHPEGLALDAAHHRVYVAIAGRDMVAAVDTSAGRVVGDVSVARAEGIGTSPVAVAVSPDGSRLYVADAGEDAVAVVAVVPVVPSASAGRLPGGGRLSGGGLPGGGRLSGGGLSGGGLSGGGLSLVGRVPTAAYTSDVAVTPDGRKLIWLAAKGLGAGPNPLYGQHFAASEAAPYGQYVPDMLLGRAGVLDVPTDAQLTSMTSVVNREIRPADLAAAPVDTPLVTAGGGPSAQIKHVFYVVKENRTYDQIFGTDPRGDGDPKLELFDNNGVAGPTGGVTPNAHRLASMFPLLDHFYADSEVSVDGHLITSGSYAIDFVQKALHASYAGRGRVLNAGQDPVTFPPNDFLFDQAIKQNIPVVNDGEINAGVLPSSDDGRPTYLPSAARTAWGYPLFFGCDNAGIVPVTATDHAVACDTDSGTMGPLGAAGVATSRFDFFQAQLEAELATNTVPALTYLTLPNDHTNGVTPNYPTPKALVADNDLGLGQIVDLISHSSIWKSSAIFVVEDDSQDGADHVDAHRMPAFVIAPWAKHGAVVHTRYDQLSALRTVEMIVGLHPLSLYDGLAEPMYDAFVSRDASPDLTPYTAVAPTQRLDQVNGAAGASGASGVSGASGASGVSGVSALDASLPYQQTDLVPQSLFDAALWRSVFGPGATPPPPGPNASVAEEARAAEALAVWRRHGDVTAWLTAHPRGADGA